jgi:Phage gp6-like head-tail connector protein
MAALVTLQRAKDQLGIPSTTTDRDDDILALVDRASAMVLTHLKSRAVAEWSVADPLPVDGVAVPGGVEIAVLLLLAQLDQHRGDDVAPDSLWKDFLIPFRDPALA